MRIRTNNVCRADQNPRTKNKPRATARNACGRGAKIWRVVAGDILTVQNIHANTNGHASGATRLLLLYIGIGASIDRIEPRDVMRVCPFLNRTLCASKQLFWNA